jgi:hypothetical protein
MASILTTALASGGTVLGAREIAKRPGINDEPLVFRLLDSAAYDDGRCQRWRWGHSGAARHWEISEGARRRGGDRHG